MLSRFYEKYHVGTKLGHPGSYGSVHAVVPRDTNSQLPSELAVKIMKVTTCPRTSRSRVRMRLLQNELKILRELKYCNIVRVYDVIETPERAFIVMEKCHGGDLFDRVMKYGGRIPESNARQIFAMLTNSIHYMHSSNMLHGDIKLSNIMFANDSDSSLKLIDFGMSRHVMPEDPPNRDMIGTPNYQAPEIIRGAYGLKADTWSLGVVLFIMLYGYNCFDPFGINDEAQVIHQRVLAGFDAKVRSGYGAYFPRELDALTSDNAKDLISKLLCSDSHTRLGTAEILRHPFFTKSNIDPDVAPAS